jgi:hypothetical protein
MSVVKSARSDALAVFGVALALRLVFSLLMAGTFDRDEFVYLALGHDVAHGAVPYRDFPFFHPPGILVLLGFLNPLTSLWWPLARLFDVLVDSLTATLVWRVGLHLFDRRVALAAGILYAINPVTLVSAVRVDQEVIATALATLGLTVLLLRRSHGGALAAGCCLALACWIKYPVVIFLPIYALIVRRYTLICLAAFTAAFLLLFIPYAGELRRVYDDTVTWQLVGRYSTPVPLRLMTAGIFWLLLNPFAVAGLLQRWLPLWLKLGFLGGGVFLLTSSIYPHYFVFIAPFAALLGAPLAAQTVRLPRLALAAVCLAALLAWKSGVETFGHQQGFIPADSFAAIAPEVRLIDRMTPPGTPIAANEMQYPFLAGRPWIAHYFWDDNDSLTARTLERHLTARSAAVLTPATSVFYFPDGFVAYLNAHARRMPIGKDMIWLLHRRA